MILLTHKHVLGGPIKMVARRRPREGPDGRPRVPATEREPRARRFPTREDAERFAALLGVSARYRMTVDQLPEGPDR